MPNCDEHCHPVSSVHQTLDELDFERGIWSAAQDGLESRVTELLSRGWNVNAQDISGYTALHYAARAGHITMCTLLLSHGANVDATTKAGQATPLQRAASTGHFAVAMLLLQAGASPYLQDADGKTALHRAVQAGHMEIAKALLDAAPDLKKITDAKGMLAIDYVNGEPWLTLLQ